MNVLFGTWWRIFYGDYFINALTIQRFVMCEVKVDGNLSFGFRTKSEAAFGEAIFEIEICVIEIDHVLQFSC